MLQDLIKILNNNHGFIGGLASLIPGGLNAIGNIMGTSERRKNKEQDMAHQEFQRQSDVNMQYDFAKNQIQWRAADAKAAGIHPLAALGASTHSPSPTMIGGGGSMGHGPGMAETLANTLGQNVDRAVMAAASKGQKEMMDINLSNARIDNEMKQMELNSRRRSLENTSGQGQIVNKPSEKISSMKGQKHVQAGSINMIQYADGPGGLIVPVLSEQGKERLEDSPQETLVQGQSLVGPTFGGRLSKSLTRKLLKDRGLLKQGYTDLEWSVKGMGWKPVKHKGRTPMRRWAEEYSGKLKKKVFGKQKPIPKKHRKQLTIDKNKWKF